MIVGGPGPSRSWASSSPAASPIAARAGTDALDGVPWLASGLIDALEQAVIATDLTGAVTYWNPAAERLYGWRAADARGDRLARLIVPPESDAPWREIMAVFSGGRSWSGELVLCDRDGRRFSAHVTGAPIRSGDQAAQIVSVSSDLTELRAAETSAATLASLVQAFDDAIVGTTPTGSVTAWNPAAERLFARARDEAVGRSLAVLVPEALRDGPLETALASLSAGQTLRVHRTAALRRDGRSIDVSLRAAPVLAPDGTVTAISWIVRDATPEIAAERTVREASERFWRIFDGSPLGMCLYSRELRILEANRALCDMLGYRREELIGRHAFLIADPEELQLSRKVVAGILGRGEGVTSLEKRYLRKDSSAVWGRLTGVALRAEDGSPELGLSMIEDVTSEVMARRERERLSRQLEYQAVTDALTGLANRAVLRDRLARAITRLERYPGQVGLLFLDLDRFKVVNESLGHGAGDLLLVEVAKRLAAVVRSSDTVGRFGGDEFVVVAEDAGSTATMSALAERIRAAIAEPVDLQGFSVAPSASIGIASSADAACLPERLFANADLAVHRAKDRGGDTCVVFSSEMRQEVMTRFVYESDLRAAIDEDQLLAHYQPCVDTSGRIAGVEALVRWMHPTRGMLPPMDFIPLAEETGLIVPLGEWILGHTCAQVATWRAAGWDDLHLSVNLSARQLALPSLTSVVEQLLVASGLPAEALCLEITETALMREPLAAAAILSELVDLGVSVAVDDFGTGYSSLLYLSRFPVDVLKLDRSFVSGLGRNPKDSAIIKSEIDLAHTLDMVAVAEGVEDGEQAAALVALGCDLLQGYHFSKPVDAEGLGALLTSGRRLLSAPAAATSRQLGAAPGRAPTAPLRGVCE